MAKSIERQLKQLERKLKPVINKTMHHDMFNMLVKKGVDEVDKTVYDAYTPSDKEGAYERTFKLRDKSWAKEEFNQGLMFTNIREDKDTGKYIPRVIETGEGYDYTGNPPYPYEYPRPFMGNIKQWLRDDKEHVKLMKEEVRKAGFKVR